MLIQSKTDLINYLNEEIEYGFVINAIMAKLQMVKEKYNISDTEPYELEVHEAHDMKPAKYSIHISKINTIKVATMVVNVDGEE